MKWEKAVNKIVIECRIKTEPTKRKYGQRMKKMWDEIGLFPVTKQQIKQGRYGQTSGLQTQKFKD